jgi:hypothetical protein
MESFTYIRNRISEYTKRSLLDLSIKVLKQAEINPSKGFAIFSILTLIKWTIIYGENKYPPKVADYKTFEKLYKKISELEELSHLKKEDNKYDFKKVFIVLAHQQFWLQDELYMTVIWRQLVLYNSLKSKYDLNLSFKNKTGLEILDFFRLAFIIFVHINPDKVNNMFSYSGVITDEWINIMDQVTSPEKRNSFFKLLTFGTDESIKRLKQDSSKLKSINLQALDTTFFSQYPIFYFNNNFFVLHKAILPNTIRHYIYDYLKESDNNFSEEFGKRLEKYIKLGINEMGVNFLPENQFKKKYPQCKKQVDFIIEDNILIESKAIELQTLPSVLPYDSILLNSLKDSIVKAFVYQMITVANYLDQSREYFGIIVTYKKLYLGSGIDCWESFLKLETEKYCQLNNLKKDVLPPDNLFFIDIDTWDVIVQLVVDKKITLENLFREVREQDRDPRTRKFDFKMYLEKFYPVQINLSFLKTVDDLFSF